MITKILTSIKELTNFLADFLCSDDSGIACVGTELRRDDFVGLSVCEALSDVGGLRKKIIKCPYGLENCLEEIIDRKIRRLLVIDAALPPNDLGALVFLSEIDNVSASFIATTHNIPVPIVINYLRMNNVAQEAYLLGIIASDLSFGEGLSNEALKGAELTQKIFFEAWNECRRKRNLGSTLRSKT